MLNLEFNKKGIFSVDWRRNRVVVHFEQVDVVPTSCTVGKYFDQFDIPKNCLRKIRDVDCWSCWIVQGRICEEFAVNVEVEGKSRHFAWIIFCPRCVQARDRNRSEDVVVDLNFGDIPNSANFEKCVLVIGAPEMNCPKTVGHVDESRIGAIERIVVTQRD